MTNYLIACFRQFICTESRRRQQGVLVTVAQTIIPLERRGKRQVVAEGGGLDFLPCSLQFGIGLVFNKWKIVLRLYIFFGFIRNLPNTFGLTSSLVKELSPSSSSDTSTSSSCKPFFGSQVILFSFFNRLLALANQQLTWGEGQS